MSNILRRDMAIKGKKAAVLIGINYTGTDIALSGCISDVACMHDLLKRGGYSDITVLTDDTSVKPTRVNIMAALERLGRLSHQGYNHLVIQYSGHGLSVEDTSGDEEDQRDEAWYSIDRQVIIDDEIRSIIDSFSPWATVFGLIDACHSGTSLDLPLRYLYDDSIVQIESKTAPLCNILMISGCRDTQTSADVQQNGQAGGAMTMSFFATRVVDNVWLMLTAMRDYMKEHNFDQQPQLSSSRVLDQAASLNTWLPLLDD
jgi:hypothetical protein